MKAGKGWLNALSSLPFWAYSFRVETFGVTSNCIDNSIIEEYNEDII